MCGRRREVGGGRGEKCEAGKQPGKGNSGDDGGERRAGLGVPDGNAFTTPEVYPLSLNGLVNACNQKNNPAPVVS